MLRVLFWTEFYWPSIGGGELFTMRLMRALRARGIEPTLVTGRLTDDLPNREVVDGVTVHRFPFRRALDRRDPLALRAITDALLEIVRAQDPHMIHMTWMGPCGIVYRQLQAKHPLPTLITLGQHLRGDVSPQSLRGRVLRDASWIAACAHWMRASLLTEIPQLADRSSVVHHAVPPSPSRPTAVDENRLLCLGRLVPCKGFDLALRAFAAIASRHPRVRLTIAGDGPERDALEQLVRSLCLDRRVDFVGRVKPEEATALMASSLMVLMPSREETFGLVALETAQQGRPIIASGIEGLAEVVVDDETGVLVPPGDVGALEMAMELLFADPVRRERLGASARVREAEQFSWERHLDAYEEIYRRLARKPVR